MAQYQIINNRSKIFVSAFQAMAKLLRQLLVMVKLLQYVYMFTHRRD